MMKLPILLVLITTVSLCKGQELAVLPFLELSEDAVQAVFHNGNDDGYAEITFPQPFYINGSEISYTTAYISTNGLLSFEESYTQFMPQMFPLNSTVVIAPYWDDIDLSNGKGNVSYENITDSSRLTNISDFITAMMANGDRFVSTSAVVIEWQNVCPAGNSNCNMANTFQMVLAVSNVTETSYAIFTYKCDLLNWVEFRAVIGFSAGEDFYDNHDLSQTLNVNDIACLNGPTAWSNVVYKLNEGDDFPMTTSMIKLITMLTSSTPSTTATTLTISTTTSATVPLSPSVSPPAFSEQTSIAAIAGGITGAVVFILILLGIIITVVIIIRKKKGTPKLRANTTDDRMVMPMQQILLNSPSGPLLRSHCQQPFLDAFPSSCLIESSNLKLIEKIGQGEFGVVYRGILIKYHNNEPITISVAVKTAKCIYTQSRLTDLLIDEAEKMMHFDHFNVLSLTGVCVDLLDSLCLVMPFMSNGSLLSYLRKESDDLTVSESADETIIQDTMKQLLSMCLQVAKGMAYLTDRKFVHRDLAARNCMISSDGIIKVADFGLAEDVYSSGYFKQDNGDCVDIESVRLPLKWLALESINFQKFNEKTDVWSYGVLCWEVFTIGKSPYAGMSPKEVVEMLASGERLAKPITPTCTNEIHSFMLSCWNESPIKRPCFKEIVDKIEILLIPLAKYMDFTDRYVKI